jgi:hypothetical protein
VAPVFAASFLTMSIPTAAHAQRHVVVNGRVMNQQALDSLDRAACQQVPNGYYWLDLSTGIWGYAGNPTPRDGPACRSAACSTAPTTGSGDAVSLRATLRA